MTPAQQPYLANLRGIRAPRRASISIAGGSKDQAAGDQGPLPDGSNLGQSPLPAASGRVPGANRFTIGNASRGNIDLGAFMSARPNQEALNQLAVNPLANVDPYQPTSGFGGFFRRLLGDNANELNAAAAADRGALAQRKWLIDQQTQAQMGVLGKQNELAAQLEDKRQQYEMERIKAREAAEQGNIQYRTKLDLEGERLRNQWAIDNARKMAEQGRALKFDELTSIVGDPVRAAMLQEQMLRAPVERMAAETAESLGRGKYYEQGGGRSAGNRPLSKYTAISDTLILNNDTGGLLNYDPITGQMTPISLGGAGGATGVVPNEAMNELTRQKMAEANQRQIVEQAGAPGSAVSGFGRAIGDAASAITSPLGGVADWLRNNSVVGAAVSEAGGALSAYDEARRAEDLNRLLQQRLLNARNR